MLTHSHCSHHRAVPAARERCGRHPAAAILPLLPHRDRDHGYWCALLGRVAHRAQVVRVRVRAPEGKARGRDRRHAGASSSCALLVRR